MTDGKPNARLWRPWHEALHARWAVTVHAAVTDAAAEVVQTVGRALVARWAEPQRRYHTSQHLAEVLDALDALLPRERGDTTARTTALLAAWYHDAVYVPMASDNEERSARLAASELTVLGVPAIVVEEVARLIRATADHADMASTTAGRALHDADLWILSSTPDRFDEYCAQVRSEYAAVPDADYGPGRRALLLPFLTAEPLYVMPIAAAWQPTARENLHREIDRLPQG